MEKDLSQRMPRSILKMLDIECLNDEEFRLFSQRQLDKETMYWAVQHLSECHECAAAASPQLTKKEIKDALAGTSFDRPDLIEQTIDYYFKMLKGVWKD